jgi:hypothetical protein
MFKFSNIRFYLTDKSSWFIDKSVASDSSICFKNERICAYVYKDSLKLWYSLQIEAADKQNVLDNITLKNENIIQVTLFKQIYSKVI